MSQTMVVLTPNWLGDAVMALPALAAVRRHLGPATLIVAARPSTAALFRMVPGVDRVLPLDASSRRADAEALAQIKADCALLLPNSFGSAWAARRAGIPERWGFASDFRRPLLTKAVRKPRGRMHQSEFYLALVSALGMTPTGEPPRVVVPDDARRRASELLARHGVGDDAVLVGMAPGAAYGGAKQWPPERFGRLARLLNERHKIVSVLVGSRADRAAGESDRARSAHSGSHRADRPAHAGRRDGARARLRVERFGRDAHGRGRRAASHRDLRRHRRAGHRAARPWRPRPRRLMRYSPATSSAGRACCASVRLTTAA